MTIGLLLMPLIIAAGNLIYLIIYAKRHPEKPS